VRLVNRHQRAGEIGEQRPKARQHQALGCHVDELVAPLRDPAHAPPRLLRIHRRGEEGRGDAARLEREHLILHQSDQRRDDQRGAGQQVGRELVHEALAAPGRHDQEQPAGGQQRLDRLALAGAERVEPERAQARVEVEPVGRRAPPIPHRPAF
jgi:hypothetical protein